MREFIGFLTYDLHQDDVYRAIYDVYSAVAAALPD